MKKIVKITDYQDLPAKNGAMLLPHSVICLEVIKTIFDDFYTQSYLILKNEGVLLRDMKKTKTGEYALAVALQDFSFSGKTYTSGSLFRYREMEDDELRLLYIRNITSADIDKTLSFSASLPEKIEKIDPKFPAFDVKKFQYYIDSFKNISTPESVIAAIRGKVFQNSEIS